MIEGRRFVGAEITGHFADVAERRIREAAGEDASNEEQAALELGVA